MRTSGVYWLFIIRYLMALVCCLRTMNMPRATTPNTPPTANRPRERVSERRLKEEAGVSTSAAPDTCLGITMALLR